MGRSILAVLVATILAISRLSINPTLPQGRVPPVPASHCLSLLHAVAAAIDYRDRGASSGSQPASATAVIPVSLPGITAHRAASLLQLMLLGSE